MTRTKPLYQSRTFWANLLGPLFLFAGTRYGVHLDDGTQAAVIVGVMSIANIALRGLTHRAVSIVPRKPRRKRTRKKPVPQTTGEQK